MMEVFNHKTFKDHRGSYTPIPLNIKDMKWNQCSISVNLKKFTLRGLHYQTSPPQTKYVKVIQGEIIDFVLDLETNQLEYVTLTNDEAVFIPPTKAHGFLTLTEDTIVAYLVEGEYSPKSEHSIVWNTIPDLKKLIQNVIGSHPITISEKDSIGK